MLMTRISAPSFSNSEALACSSPSCFLQNGHQVPRKKTRTTFFLPSRSESRIHGNLEFVAGFLLCCAGMIACTDGTAPEHRRITRVDPPAGVNAMAPNLLADGDGALMTWLEPEGEGHALRVARLIVGDGWSVGDTVVSGDDFFANWADFPGVARGSDGALLAHWLAKSGSDTYAYDVRLARASALGARWQTLGSAHDDGVKAEHGFVSTIPEGDAVRVFWLDGRAMQMSGAGHGGAADEGAMTLRTALVRGGVVSSGELLDSRVCDCCQTAAAMTADGPVVVYRDRSKGEVRDIQIIRQTTRGWSAPASVHDDGWVVPGCPVNGPSIASTGRTGRRLAVAWFTAEANHPRVQVAFSQDSGATFGPPVMIDATAPLGRVSVVLAGEDEAVVGWLAGTEGEEAAIRLARARSDGKVGEPLTVTATSSSRASGFPRMVLLGDELLVAWTEAGESSHLRAALVPILMVPEASRTATMSAHVVQTLPVARAWDRLEGSMAPDYAARTPEGATVDLAGMRGQVVLVNIWATWCVPCRVEMPELTALHERYGQRGLRIVGISVDVDLPPAEVRAFAAAEKIPYLILHDPEDRASVLFTGQQMLPASFLFDKEGLLIWSRIGLIGKDDPGLAKALAGAVEAR